MLGERKRNGKRSESLDSLSELGTAASTSAAEEIVTLTFAAPISPFP